MCLRFRNLPTRLLLTLVFAAPAVLAQSAGISGVVRDASQAVIAGAIVTATQEATRAQRDAITSSEGGYAIPFLAPGNYTVEVESAGFQTARETGVKLDVAQAARLDFTLHPGSITESVTVDAAAALVNTDSATVSTVVNRQFIENLPVNGRSFQTLIALAPGVVLTSATFGEQGQFSVNGQRANANYFTIDGASANIGVSAGLTLVQSASGSLPGLGATGGTNPLVSVDALEEFRVQTSSYAAEYGRTPGAQITILTRSGTNQFHGVLFDYLRNDKLDANDWFANQDSLGKAALRQNDFGGVLGGPIIRNKTFFFFSYEGLRLLQPQVESTDVPSLQSRQQAPAAMQPYLNSFPLPNRPNTRFGFAPFVAGFDDQANLDATSLRVDHIFNTRLAFFGRYNYAPSNTTARLYAIDNPTTTVANTTTLTLGATIVISPRLTNETRANLSVTTGASFSSLDTFGGATPLDPSVFFPPFADPKNSFGGFFLNGGVDSGWYLGKNVSNTQHQYNVTDAVSLIAAAHQIKIGVDYRRIGTFNGARAYDQLAYFNGALAAAAGVASEVLIDAQDAGSLHFLNLSLYAQDTWKAARRLTLTYGLRWEFNPAPLGGPNHPLYTFEGYANPNTIQLAPLGTPMYAAGWHNFAPRLGAAYQFSRAPGRETTLRAGFGMFYDLGAGLIGQAASSFPYYRTAALFDVLYPLAPAAAQAPSFSLQPPVSSIYGAVNGLKLPVTYQWNVTLEQALGRSSAISAGYVAAAGRNLLRQEYFINPNANFTYAYLLTNLAFSNFDSLQVQFKRRLSHGLQALVSYTWSHSLDNASNDSSSYLEALQLNPKLDYGPSDFDIRHALSAAFTYALPGRRLALRNWSLDGVVSLRTATPVDVTYSRDLGFGLFNFRPDLVTGVPLYLSDPNVAGGRMFNPDAFALSTQYPGRQGTLAAMLCVDLR